MRIERNQFATLGLLDSEGDFAAKIGQPGLLVLLLEQA